jgi:hypothetical protein
MWMMTKLGFFSTVEDRDNKDGVIVRARCEQDIVNISYFMQMKDAWWLDTLADYGYRLRCSKPAWAAAVAQMAGDIDYDNFKSSITDERHHSAYQRVWIDMLYIDDRVIDGTTWGDML